MINGQTLYLGLNWDIALDDSGNIQRSAGAYAIAQNVANAVRLFVNDSYFEKDRGIPHFDIELKTRPNLTVLRQRIRSCALSVQGVLSASVYLDENYTAGRTLSGHIDLTVADGDKNAQITVKI